MKHPKKEPKLFCNFPVRDLQTRYFRGYHYNFWITKANLLKHFIEHPELVDQIQPESKESNAEYILDNFKMDIHMMVFHSAESLFLNIMAAIFNPDYPWVFLAKCTPERLNSFIKQIAKDGIEKVLAPAPVQFMRELMYPGIGEKHPKLDLASKTTEQVIKYLTLLAREYMDHFEYNAYKHGLRSFPGESTNTFRDEATGEVFFHSKQYSIEYLEFKNEMIEGTVRQRIMITDKTFDFKRDYGLIEANTAILRNMFHKRKVDLDATKEKPGKYMMFLLTDETVDLTELFEFNTDGSVGAFMKKFSV